MTVYGFECAGCWETSVFSGNGPETVRRALPIDVRVETRQYECEYCGQPNNVKLTRTEWAEVDRQEPGGAPRVTAGMMEHVLLSGVLRAAVKRIAHGTLPIE
jgi:hypothetical protein